MCGIIGVVLGDVSGTKNRSYELPSAPEFPGANEQKLQVFRQKLQDAFQQTYGLMSYRAFRDMAQGNRAADVEKSANAFADLGTRILREIESAKGKLHIKVAEIMNACVLLCKDIAWQLNNDLHKNLLRVSELSGNAKSEHLWREYWKLNVLLNNLDRLEIRGRDSAGIVSLFTFPEADAAEGFLDKLKKEDREEAQRRLKISDFVNLSVKVKKNGGSALALTHKVAEEIGVLGQNVAKLREHICKDALLRIVVNSGATGAMLAHTRWASNGIINEQNCHPVNNDPNDQAPRKHGIYAALNGDIDNYLELKTRYETRTGQNISAKITTDTKIIPLVIDEYLSAGNTIEEAFRLAVNDFRGSIAIAMISVADPEKVYLALRGSGQSLYVGLFEDSYIFASETYGLVEQTNRFIKMDGEKINTAGNPSSQGQIFVLDRKKSGTLAGIKAISFDGANLPLNEDNIRSLEITTRDINRAGYPHFLLKEISESPRSVEKTLFGRFSIEEKNGGHEPVFAFDETVIPEKLRERLVSGRITRILLVGQGTAAVAGEGIASIMNDFFKKRFTVSSMKASELSGFALREDMSDTLVVAVSQSGTTTDTNRTVDLVRRRDGMVVGIVNRRNSDLVYKADGVLYTSDGRDVEMSVASTKAFYCQVVAGYLLTIYLARLTGVISAPEAVEELQILQSLPRMMEEVLAQSPQISEAANRLAPRKRYWATVGNGANKVAADEVRIKLSELCYKSIATDYTEDKKHIDLSSEPMVLVFAAGLSGPNLSDVMKEVSIFKAHNALPIVVTSCGETKMEDYAAASFQVPSAPETVSFLLSTMVGHLFGYYAAMTIDSCAQPLREARATVVRLLEKRAWSDPRLVDELSRELELPRRKYMDMLYGGRLNTVLETDTAAEILVLFDRLVLGRHERRESKSDLSAFPLENFLKLMTRAVGESTRPVDAIKHQAKTVTVGISREKELPSGALFDAITAAGFAAGQLSFGVYSMLQGLASAVEKVNGYTVYKVNNLDALGQPDTNTSVSVVLSEGIAKQLVSRTGSNKQLRGTKRQVLEKGSVFFGLGGYDQRPIVILPVMEKGLRRYVFLAHVDFKDPIELSDKVGVLKVYEHIYDDIRTAVTEVLPEWDDNLLEKIPLVRALSDSPRDIAREIVKSAKGGMATPD